MVFSFDIFDTLFSRIFFRPDDLYFFLEKRLKEEGLIDEDLDFSGIRMQTEENVRTVSIKEDINFNELYHELGKNLNLSQGVNNRIKNLELDFEEFSLSVIDETRHKIDKDSVLISDIYLNKDFIQHLLKKYNISYRTLYLSSDLGLMKHYGSLFKKVLSDLKITGDQLTHLGDNLHSDVKIANKYNIKALYYKNSKPTIYENYIYSISRQNKINSILAGSMKSSRLEGFYSDMNQQTIWNVATDVAGPFLFLYSFWILKKAHQLKIKNLYFIARDGQIIYESTKIINRYLGYKINLKYLFGSRKAWHLASLEEVTERELDWIFDPTQFLNIDTICSRAEIDHESIRTILLTIGINDNHKKLSDSQIDNVRNLFSSNKTILDLIIHKAREKRSLVSRYLKQEGFDSNKTIGIVDVGWRARQQHSLSKILDLEGLYPKTGIHGFYISLPNKVSPFSKDSTHEYLPHSKYDHIVDGYSLIYESFVAADHGSCVSYRKNKQIIEPVLREEKNNAMLKWGLSIHQKGILTFTQKFTDALSFLRISEIQNGQGFSEVLLHNFLKYPSKQEAIAYNEIDCFEDQEEGKGIKLSVELSSLDLIVALVRPRNVFDPNHWKEASFAISIKKYYSYYQRLFQFALIFVRKIRNVSN